MIAHCDICPLLSTWRWHLISLARRSSRLYLKSVQLILPAILLQRGLWESLMDRRKFISSRYVFFIVCKYFSHTLEEQLPRRRTRGSAWAKITPSQQPTAANLLLLATAWPSIVSYLRIILTPSARHSRLATRCASDLAASFKR